MLLFTFVDYHLLLDLSRWYYIASARTTDVIIYIYTFYLFLLFHFTMMCSKTIGRNSGNVYCSYDLE